MLRSSPTKLARHARTHALALTYQLVYSRIGLDDAGCRALHPHIEQPPQLGRERVACTLDLARVRRWVRACGMTMWAVWAVWVTGGRWAVGGVVGGATVEKRAATTSPTAARG